MAEIKSFRALRFTEKAGDIKELVCPPYDIISDEARENYIRRNKNNIIRLELPSGENKYEAAGEILHNWIEDGILKRDQEDSIYVYEQEFSIDGANYKLKGIISLVKLHEFSDGIVIPHEETLSKAKTDRFNLMTHTSCNFSQIYSLYKDDNNTVPLIDEISNRNPDIEFTSDEGVIQRLWICSDSVKNNMLVNKFAAHNLYIADGHHRYETALNYYKSSGRETAGYVMMMLVDIDNDGLIVLPTHRMVRDLHDFDLNSVLEKIKIYFDIEKIDGNNITSGDWLGMYTGEDYWYKLILRDKLAVKKYLPDMSDDYCELDVTILHSLILERIFGIDKKNMMNQVNLVYTRDVKEAVEGVSSRHFQCSFILNSTKVNQIKAVGSHGEKMPQKSTYFYPKLITGLVMNQIQ